jgi:protein TonB
MTAPALVLSDAPTGEEFRRWCLAAALVCAAHFGLLAAYLVIPAEQPEGAAFSPAVMVELAPLPVAPASADDLAPGPDMVEAAPAPKPAEQVPPEIAPMLPVADTPAEVTLPPPEPTPAETKPEEDVGKAEREPARDSAPAPRTTAAPRSEQRTAAIAQAPSPGSAASSAAIAHWRDLVLARLQQMKRYPPGAEARREQGVATLSFSLDRRGRVLTRSIRRSSGFAALDQEVLAMVQRAEPLPAFPAAMPQNSVNLVVPIRFSLR